MDRISVLRNSLLCRTKIESENSWKNSISLSKAQRNVKTVLRSFLFSIFKAVNFEKCASYSKTCSVFCLVEVELLRNLEVILRSSPFSVFWFDMPGKFMFKDRKFHLPKLIKN